jgi:microsomal dipeptidase-like Zn-dependent dipeptidase
MPGLSDASELPNLRAGLAARGYGAAEISAIMGGNALAFLERLGH